MSASIVASVNRDPRKPLTRSHSPTCRRASAAPVKNPTNRPLPDEAAQVAQHRMRRARGAVVRCVMIPHHSGAVLMCRKANLADDRIKKLCSSITESQLSEIAQMKDLLNREQKSAQSSSR
ncbi:DUF305 domain-containing protein [Bradyrhizobium sp. BR 1432]|uniref:DUF305 domain-containing protein n=1 Tax=Bradyrhizobium sp. BR 1432 TaxID=3447966 RepID=UPI003EE69447